jgi:hypothetical protein
LKFEKDPSSGCRDNRENEEMNLGDRVVGGGGGWWWVVVLEGNNATPWPYLAS